MNDPNAPARAVDWSDANQQLLIAEFQRLRERLSDHLSEHLSDPLSEHPGDAKDMGTPAVKPDQSRAADPVSLARARMPAPASIDRLAGLFGLSVFERDLLLLAAGVQMDARLAALCARASGSQRGGGLTFSFALSVLASPHWSALSPGRPLRRWQLLELDAAVPVTEAVLRIDERILHALAGVDSLDARLHGLIEPLREAVPMAGLDAADRLAPSHRASVATIVAALQRQSGGKGVLPTVVLTGDDSAAQTDVAAAIADSLGCPLYRLRAEDLPANAAEMNAIATLWAREAQLAGAALLISAGQTVPTPGALRFVAGLRGLRLLAASAMPLLDGPVLHVEIDRPMPAEQRQLWQRALAADLAADVQTHAPTQPSVRGSAAPAASPSPRPTSAAAASPSPRPSAAAAASPSPRPSALRSDLAAQIDSVAGQFRLGARTVFEIAAALTRPVEPGALWAACRSAGRVRLDELAQRVRAQAGWDDLMLAEAQTATLHAIAAQCRNRLRVHQDWGFASQGERGLGMAVLFAGASGTGKTLAAEVLARELALDLYRIDLSALISKYIGETEKNLRRVFDAADDGGAVLLFDEADALFGKRSEVRDSHDRYANLEVSYLLQRMEAYRGLAILTSNLKGALDPAFQRRLRFVVAFPFPDVHLREALWRRAFPPDTPLQGIDPVRLARLDMAGGSIRNIALNAAFAAAEEGTPVAMRHLLGAAQLEAAKRDRPLSDAETRGWL